MQKLVNKIVEIMRNNQPRQNSYKLSPTKPSSINGSERSSKNYPYKFSQPILFVPKSTN